MATNSPFAPLAEAQDFLLDRVAETPEDFRNKLREIIRPGNLPLPIATRDAAELIYAWRDKLPKGMIEIGVRLTQSLIFWRQFDYQNERGPAMIAAFEGDEGEAPAPERELTPEALSAPQPLLSPPPESYARGPL